TYGVAPPRAVNETPPRGGTVALVGAMARAALIVTSAVRELPRESTTCTRSMAFPAEPAVYRPDEPTLPPDPFVVSDQAKPDPLPPLAVNCCVPRGGNVAFGGAIETPALTDAFAY